MEVIWKWASGKRWLGISGDEDHALEVAVAGPAIGNSARVGRGGTSAPGFKIAYVLTPQAGS